MESTILRKTLYDAENNGASYAHFALESNNIAFVSDAGKRKSTRNLKCTDKELKQCISELDHMDIYSMLSFTAIKEIKYELPDGSVGEIKLKQIGTDINKIIQSKSSLKKSKEQWWFRSKDRNGYGISFALKPHGEQYEIIPSKGYLISSPFEKNSIDNLFCILLPFEKSVKSNKKTENKQDEVNNAVADSLCKAIFDCAVNRLIGSGIYGVLPSTMDDESDMNAAMIKSIKKLYHSRPIIKTNGKRMLSASNVIIGTDEVVRLFDQKLIDKLFDTKCKWLMDYKKGGREEYFVQDIGIKFFDRESFLDVIFDEEFFDALAEILAAQKDEWLREFYSFCAGEYMQNSVKTKVISGFANIRSIRDMSGNMRYPYEVTILTDIMPLSKESPILKPSLLGTQNGNKTSNSLIEFFRDDIKVKEYSQTAEIEQLLNYKGQRGREINGSFCKNLYTLAVYSMDNPGKLEFEKCKIFPYKSAKGIRRTLAANLIIGKPYNDNTEGLGKILGKNLLWSGMKRYLSAEQLSEVISFAIRCGAFDQLRIMRQSARKHPQFSEKLLSSGRISPRDTDYDYTISGLEELIKKKSVKINRMIWQAIISSDKELSSKAVMAEYSSGNRETVRNTESSLIRLLKETAWVPGDDNKLYKPKDLRVGQINKELKYNRNNPILKSLQFGSSFNEDRKTLREIEIMAKAKGYELVLESDYAEYIRWKNRREARRTKK